MVLIVSALAFARAQAPNSKTGQIRNGSYENSFFGFSFTPAQETTLRENEFVSEAKSDRNFMLFHADAGQNAGKTTMQIVAYADSHSAYPEGRRSSEAYLDRVARHQQEQGYEVLNERKKVQLGNSTFFRADFRKAPVTETVLVTSRKGYALVFIFAGRDSSAVEHLISSSRISFATHDGE